MSESIFIADGSRFRATDHARGPWDPAALHGGAPAALMSAALERTEPGSQLEIARMGFEFVRPIPLAELELSTRVVRSGRRVQELACELRCGEDLICRAGALRVRRVPAGLPEAPSPPRDAAPGRGARMPGPDTAKAVRWGFENRDSASFATSAMEMRWLSDPWTLGPGRVWMRLRHPLVPDEPLTPLARLVATADFGNGISAVLPFDRFLFINADLTIHLQRPPVGEWIGLDSQTVLEEGGTGLTESVLYDLQGALGRAFQALVVEPR